MGDWVRALANNLLVRELGLVALLILAVVIYYFRYVHAAKSLRGRHQRGKLQRLISGTRGFMILVAVALVAVLGYDRVWPHFAPEAKATPVAVATSSTHAKKASTKAKAASKKATASTASSTSSTASDSTTSSSSSAPVETEETRAAVQLVNGYFDQHADQLDTTKLVVYRYLGDTTGNAQLPVHRVGGFVKEKGKLVQKYEFWVYPGNKFDQQDSF